ncbi:hypothetical protein GGX14DRAFT_698570 [Mycena pura]|uniref:Heme haloperoxidase family profile domain-containing protein n=1 Tax=Mycena pura TaxID=153505 RepID=A0AAD6YC83_9AGAR|nr:hypothetical protein GGX14DRAFT_698570 [Mycena pura]
MKSFSLPILVVSPLLIAVNARPNIRATLDIQDGQTGKLMVFPPQQTDTGTKRMPIILSLHLGPTTCADVSFLLLRSCLDPSLLIIFYSMPGYEYARQPWLHFQEVRSPPLFLPRLIDPSQSGITNFAEIIRGTGEAFNIDPVMASGMAALNLLTRGNPFVDKVSVGGVSPFVPPLPGKIDGPETQGIAKHGRVEGDASMTRSDVHIGDNRNFNQTLWDMDLEQLAMFGDDGPDGPATVFNLQTLIELKRHNLESDQTLDPEFAIPIRRLNAAFGAPSLIMRQVLVFANGTTKQATKRIISSFFMNQTFPENWFRAAAPVLGSPIPAELAAALPQWVPGHNDENGVFVADPQPPAPFNISSGCANYWDTLVNAVPGTLAHFPFLPSLFMAPYVIQGILFNASGCSEPIAPAGPTNV